MVFDRGWRWFCKTECRCRAWPWQCETHRLQFPCHTRCAFLRSKTLFDPRSYPLTPLAEFVMAQFASWIDPGLIPFLGLIPLVSFVRGYLAAVVLAAYLQCLSVCWEHELRRTTAGGVSSHILKHLIKCWELSKQFSLGERSLHPQHIHKNKTVHIVDCFFFGGRSLEMRQMPLSKANANNREENQQ